jgi:MFS family permease
VPDEKKGRFNGVFNMVASGGMLLGQLLAGGLTLAFSERMVLLIVAMVNVVMAVVIIGGNKRHVAPIYNRQQ